jgi:beta-lactamase superfamily II metal-dependent hydrolase
MIDIQHEISLINEKWKSSKLKDLNEKLWTEEVFNEIVEHPLFKENYPEDVINAKFDQLLNSVPQTNIEMNLYCMVSALSSQAKVKIAVNEILPGVDGSNYIRPTTKEEYIEIDKVFTLVAYTKEMIEVDTEFFKQVNSDDGNRYSVLDLIYKPYSYVLDIDFSDPYYAQVLEDPNGCYCFSVVPYIHNNDSDSVRIGRIWKAASPEENYPVEIKFFRKLGYFSKFDQEGLNQDIDNKIIQLNAILERYLSAIPNELIDNRELVVAEMDKMFDSQRRYTAEVLRVGQANAIVLNDDNYRFAFDLGLPLYCFRVIENGQFNREQTGYRDNDDLKINNLDLNSIVISHWHDDHYLGMFSIKRSFYIGSKAGLVIAPLFNKNTKLAYRLVAYLIKRRKIQFIKEECFVTNSNGDRDYLAFRLCDDKDVNNDSILLLMKNTLFPGDCFHDRWKDIIEYSQINDKGRVENMLVIHHGSRLGNPTQRSKFLEAVLSDVRHKAIICVGNNDSETENMHYHHPDDDVIHYYENIGFEQVIRTDSDVEEVDSFRIKLY